jgi:hypothetical protein
MTVKGCTHRKERATMFNKEQLDILLGELKSNYGNEPDWEQILKDAHLGIARSDAEVDLGKIDPRVIEIIKTHRG